MSPRADKTCKLSSPCSVILACPCLVVCAPRAIVQTLNILPNVGWDQVEIQVKSGGR